MVSILDRVKEGSPFLQRLALRTQLRTRLRQRAWVERCVSEAEALADALESARARQSPVRVTYDTASAPPTFGDFVNVAMLVRLLQSAGIDASLGISDGPSRQANWLTFTQAEQEQRLADLSDLSRLLVAQSPDGALAPRDAIDLTPRSEALCNLAPTLMSMLTAERGWGVPEGFLLPPSNVPAVSTRKDRPYVAWHIRRERWDKGRDATQRDLERDYRALTDRFPDHSLMVFSSREGQDAAISHLEGRFGLSTSVLLPQPVQGFALCAPYVLGADFYFQRRGGGSASTHSLARFRT